MTEEEIRSTTFRPLPKEPPPPPQGADEVHRAADEAEDVPFVPSPPPLPWPRIFPPL